MKVSFQQRIINAFEIDVSGKVQLAVASEFRTSHRSCICSSLPLRRDGCWAVRRPYAHKTVWLYSQSDPSVSVTKLQISWQINRMLCHGRAQQNRQNEYRKVANDKTEYFTFTSESVIAHHPIPTRYSARLHSQFYLPLITITKRIFQLFCANHRIRQLSKHSTQTFLTT